MSTVTYRVTQVKQPRGGYIKPSLFSQRLIEDGSILNEQENIAPAVVGMAVDYLTRFVMGEDIMNVFMISCRGAILSELIFNKEHSMKIASTLLSNIKGLDDTSIINACKLSTYDVYSRIFLAALKVKNDSNTTNPDKYTIENIRVMVERSVRFWKEYGPIIKSGFTFEQGGYTETVRTGDGDYLSADTIWDFKVSKHKPKSKDTLQLLMYWIMGQHCDQPIYKNISNLGIFNPRLNTVYTLNIKLIDQEIIEKVENEVICY